MKSKLTLYPHLAASVNLDYFDQADHSLFDLMAAHTRELSSPAPATLESLVSPRVVEMGAQRYQLAPVGGEFSLEVRGQILEAWHAAGASQRLLEVLAAAQAQLIRRLVVEPDGMIPDRRRPAKIGVIGRRKLKSKEVIRLLTSLKLSYRHDWPIEQLANIVRPYAKKTRGKKSGRSRR